MQCSVVQCSVVQCIQCSESATVSVSSPETSEEGGAGGVTRPGPGLGQRPNPSPLTARPQAAGIAKVPPRNRRGSKDKSDQHTRFLLPLPNRVRRARAGGARGGGGGGVAVCAVCLRSCAAPPCCPAPALGDPAAAAPLFFLAGRVKGYNFNIPYSIYCLCHRCVALMTQRIPRTGGGQLSSCLALPRATGPGNVHLPGLTAAGPLPALFQLLLYRPTSLAVHHYN